MTAQTYQADKFVDSVGINLHLTWGGTLYYTNFSLIQSSLLGLGIRHVRDGLTDTTWQTYYDQYNQLGAAGIHGTFIAEVGQTAALLESWPSRVSSSFEGFEGPSEYDISGDQAWPAHLAAFLPVLYNAAKHVNGGGVFPVYGPSLVNPTGASYAALGNVSEYYDYGNLHNYFGGRNPGTGGWGANGYGSIVWNLAQIVPYTSGKPIVTTETGYDNDLPLPGTVPQVVSGRYAPRMLMEQYLGGLRRTYIYQLCDISLPGYQQLFGLLNLDGSPKPAYTAVAGLMNLLSDPGPAFTPTPLDVTLAGKTGHVQQMIFQKRNGTYYVALWLEDPSFNNNTYQMITVYPQNITVQVTNPVTLANIYQWQDTGSVTQTPQTGAGQTTALALTDRLTILQYNSGIPVTVTSSPAGLSVGVDGTNITTPQSFLWVPGTTHVLDATLANTQAASEEQFSAWSDTGAAKHSITAGSTAKSYTASYATKYLFGAQVQPAGAGSVAVTPSSTDGFYLPSTSLTLSEQANPGFVFDSWTGAASGTNSSTSFTFLSAAEATANFSCTYTLSGLSTLPAAGGSLSISVNTGTGCTYSAATTASWITFTNASGSGNGAVTATFPANTSGTTKTGTITVAGQTIEITQAIGTVPVTFTSNPVGLRVVIDGVSDVTPHTVNWMPGSRHGVTATSPQSSDVFKSWSDGVITTGRTITTPSVAETFTATFVP